MEETTFKSSHIPRPRRSTNSANSNSSNHLLGQRIVISTRLLAIADNFERKERSRFVISPVPTDLTIQVHDISFYVHKYPLLSRCGYMNRVDFHQSDLNFPYHLTIESFPGGPDTFETVLKCCYGLPVDITAGDIAPLRCGAEFLDMNEEMEEGNLIAKTESFLTWALSSWKNSVAILKSCEPLSPWAENLQIIRRCCDSIAWKASHNPFNRSPASSSKRWWLEQLSTLRIDHFVRVIMAARAKGMTPEAAGACIVHYAERWLVEFDGDHERKSHGVQLTIVSGRRTEEWENKEKRRMIESLVSILPQEREAASCEFLVWMLKTAMVYGTAPALVEELEKRVGIVLEDATLADLLIPNYKHADANLLVSSIAVERTMHDVDVVQRIVEYFLMHEEQQHPPKCSNITVGKLLDGYLAEIATDPNLSLTKFQQLAEILPENARTCHDGLYRAIDTYLKRHPSLMEHNRRRLCKVMNCEKLSLDACMHAAKNQRLPLRTVVQVLFIEQLKVRSAIEAREPAANNRLDECETIMSSTTKEIKILKTELEGLKIKLKEMQKDYSDLQLEFDRFHKQKNGAGWSSGWRRFKNSAFFHVKVDSDDTGSAPQRNSNRIFKSRRASIS